MTKQMLCNIWEGHNKVLNFVNNIGTADIILSTNRRRIPPLSLYRSGPLLFSQNREQSISTQGESWVRLDSLLDFMTAVAQA